MTTGFYWDEQCFWFSGGNYAFTQPVGGLVQPLAAGGIPESPETKRRLKNLMDVTGLTRTLVNNSANAASTETLLRVHPQSYLESFFNASQGAGGELGLRTPFGHGGYEQAALSTGLACRAVTDVMAGRVKNAYSLSRPPGHHCLPDFPNGFCLFANIAVAVQAARAIQPELKVAILDWDVHHGNGTEAIFLEDPSTLTLSIHQENNYPLDTGAANVRGVDNSNVNIPLPPGAGHKTYLRVFSNIVRPALDRFKPDLIVVACGFDASSIDPLSRMLATVATFAALTRSIKQAAHDLCGDRLVLVHEGGYSEVYVPFCGHATIATLADSLIDAPDPFMTTFDRRQPAQRFQTVFDEYIDELAEFHAT
jgi:acetoin utilization deacetylase AcuC-like enzyme